MRTRWFLRDLFVPRVIRRLHSPINGLVEVVLVFNRPRLMVEGLVQSGGVVQELWNKGISKLKKDNLN